MHESVHERLQDEFETPGLGEDEVNQEGPWVEANAPPAINTTKLMQQMTMAIAVAFMYVSWA